MYIYIYIYIYIIISHFTTTQDILNWIFKFECVIRQMYMVYVLSSRDNGLNVKQMEWYIKHLSLINRLALIQLEASNEILNVHC